MIMFFLGEVTSPLLNAFTFMGTLRHGSKTCSKMSDYLSPIFTGASRHVARGRVGPAADGEQQGCQHSA